MADLAELGLFSFDGPVGPAPHVLADRYISEEMARTFSDTVKITLERDFWTTVMEEQRRLGIDSIPEGAAEDYAAARLDVDKVSIRKREKVLKHDVSARLEEFNHLAGHEHAQKGMTSRDVTENVEQLQILEGLKIIDTRTVATLARLATLAAEHTLIPMAGRSHNVAAQVTTLGKRFTNAGQEILYGYGQLGQLINTYPMRGIKGPVGTAQDMLDLFEGDEDKVYELEQRVAARLGFTEVLDSVGQVYPRSLDFAVISGLKLVTSGVAKFAVDVRLMAGNQLVTEGFKPGQVGSLAMPHKMNARTSERIGALHKMLTGNVATAAQQSGTTWNEGDVECSATRRVIIPDSFYLADGIFQSGLSVMNGFGAYPAVISAELNRYLPFLATTKALMAAIKAGAPREKAHHTIRDHAVAVALDMQETGRQNNDLFDRLVADKTLKLSRDMLDDAIGNPLDMSGTSRTQVKKFVAKVEAIVAAKPEAASYVANEVL